MQSCATLLTFIDISDNEMRNELEDVCENLLQNDIFEMKTNIITSLFVVLENFGH